MNITYFFLIVPILAYLVTQATKLIFDGIRGNFNISHMYSTYGGMPSAHSAFVVSLAAIVGFEKGIASAEFAICAVFGLIALRDAMGFRRQIGKHAEAINTIRDALSIKQKQQIPVLEEQVGHSPYEVFVGSIFGLLISVLFHLFIIP